MLSPVEKDHFKKVIQQYPTSSSGDAEEVLLLKESFPYSQLLHALSARLTKDHGFSNQQTELQLAAVYAADRTVLKEVMTQEAQAAGTPAVTAVAKPSVAAVSPAKTLNTSPPKASVITEDLAEEVIHDLERLHELKHNFEMMFVEDQDGASKPVAKTTPVETPKVEAVKAEEDGAKEHTKSKKERIIELAKAMQQKEQQTQEPEPETDASKSTTRKKRKDQPGEELIDEIISTKEEIVPENDKQKEQIELIDQFIKSQPSITAAKDKEKAQGSSSGDLSTIKTGEFGDNVVSETLAEILIKQGKKDKAIEVLKKLIWKFPQKKAYFAAQIEELKK